MLHKLSKKGRKKDTEKNRSLSVLLLTNKIFERTVYERLYRFLNNRKKLQIEKLRIRQGCSTLHALPELIEDTPFRSISMFVSILFDLIKAFDTIDHSNFLKSEKSIVCREFI